MGVRSLALLIALLVLTGQALAGRLPDTIVLSPKVLAATKQRILERDRELMPAYKAFIADADRALKAPAEAVILKASAPPGGTMHDYWSLAPYWWPNNETLDGLPYVRRDGQRNPQSATEKYDRARMRRMSSDALTLALAWYMTGDEEYAGKATGLIWSWVCDSVTRMNPSLNYAQSRPGIADGTHYGIIETRDLIKVCEAARILEPSHTWSKVVTKKVTSWFTDYLKWLQKSSFGRKEGNSLNNHGTWYDAQVAVFAMYIGKESLARSIVTSGTPMRILSQIESDGTMPRELERTRSRHYTFFNLEAFFILAAIAEHFKVDMWKWTEPNGVSIRKAFDLAAPHIAKDAPWEYGKTGVYDPFAFTALFHRAAMVYKDDRYTDFLKALPADKLKRDRAQLFY
ncbi:alginate lyase family protein [Pseudodesulfovibrio sp. zrk46]|uniref:alginate lyase family protein n=1 Tax=Pseudodesulfovibrio sp. zrk46 TaxID=2725288 RepID=UPI0014497838|nr:alginate lyase family protein [Pseudodesulfovibrio sp. zrk46]QJB57016.1 alginate lyase family protein [Pseudodesulfovibrio sp. zrk46]